MAKMKYLAAILVLIAFATGCSKDFLEKEPLTDRVEANFYQTPEDAFQALVAIYDVLGWQSSQGYHPHDLVCNILSDDAYAGGSGPGDRPDLVRMGKFSSYPTDEAVLGLWSDRYAGVYRANLLLEKIENIPFENEDLKTRYIAEAKFLRAYFYFQLEQFYGNIPLILKTLSPNDKKIAQADPADVYNQIAEDLWYAWQNLPASVSSTELGRATKWAAGGLLSRVYLYHKGYGKNVLNLTSDMKAGDKIISEDVVEGIIDDIINTSGHGLVTDYSTLFYPGNKNLIESVFEIQHTNKSNWGDWGWRNGSEGNWTVIMTGFRGVESDIYETGWSFQPVTQSLANEMKTDPRYSVAILDAEAEGLVYKPGDCFQHTGYAFKKMHPLKAFKPSTNDMLNWPYNEKVLRFADILLMGAELYLDNDLSKAQEYFNRMFKRAHGNVATPPVLTNSEAGLDVIYHERRMEFAGEGLRYWDLLRRGLDYAAQKINAASQASPLDETFNMATRGLLPIPQSEITLSENTLVQNPGY